MWTRGEVTTRAQHPYAVLTHRGEMGSTRDQVDFHARTMQSRTDVGTDRSSSENSDLHSTPRSATLRKEIAYSIRTTRRYLQKCFLYAKSCILSGMTSSPSGRRAPRGSLS